MANQFVVIEDCGYDVNTVEEIDSARAALVSAGLDSVPIWYGDRDDPSSYKSEVHKLFASAHKQRGAQ